VVLVSFPLWPGKLSFSSCIFGPFVFLLKISAQFIYSFPPCVIDFRGVEFFQFSIDSCY
jgi:hypothetical protein